MSVFPKSKDSPQIVMLWSQWLKWRATGFDAFYFFLHLVGVRESGLPIFSLFRLRRSSYTVCRICNMTSREMHIKWSVILVWRMQRIVIGNCSSSHPQHVKNAIPCSQFLWLRRLYNVDSHLNRASSAEKCASFSKNVASLTLPAVTTAPANTLPKTSIEKPP